MIAHFPITDENGDIISSIYNSRAVKRNILHVERNPTYNPSQSSLESLINSSSFDLIKNKQLKGFLMSWKDLVIDYQETELRYTAFVDTQLIPFRLKHISPTKNTDDQNLITLDHIQKQLFENLIRQRCQNMDYYNSDPIGEVALVRQTIDSIISLTESYAE